MGKTLQTESTLTDRYQATISEPIRESLQKLFCVKMANRNTKRPFFQGLLCLTSCLLLQIILTVGLSPPAFAITLNDNGKISPTNISHVICVKSEADILKAIEDASSKHIPIAIMGKQHSQGGQSLAPNAIALDMLSFNKVLRIDKRKNKSLWKVE